MPKSLGSKSYYQPTIQSRRTSDISPSSSYRQESPSERARTEQKTLFDGLVKSKPSIFGNNHCICIFCKGHGKKFPFPTWGSTYADIRYQNGEFCYCVFCKGCREFFEGPVEERGRGELLMGGVLLFEGGEDKL
jgi:hypothetical protein